MAWRPAAKPIRLAIEPPEVSTPEAPSGIPHHARSHSITVSSTADGPEPPVQDPVKAFTPAAAASASAPTYVLGLPIRGEGRPGYEHLVHGSASVLYLRNTGRAFWELGDLAARPEPVDDGCKASCVDWYGNARPIFLGDRVFALLGYEIVEGRIEEDGIHEVGRISYAPRRASRSDD